MEVSMEIIGLEKFSRTKEFADMYFFKTLVRIHNAGEGGP